MALYKRKDSSVWQYEFEIKGKRYRGTTGEANKKRAEVVEARKRTEAADGKIAVGRKVDEMDLTTACDKYRDYAKGLTDPLTVDSKLRYLETTIGGGRMLHDITVSDVTYYIDVRSRAVSNTTVNRDLQVLRAMLRRARKNWNVKAAEIEFADHWLPEPDSRVRYLRPHEFEALIVAAPEYLVDPIKFSLLTGLRKSNVRFLDWEQIDWYAKTMTFKVKSKKVGGKVHVLPITEDIEALLRRQGVKPDGLVFLRDGKPMCNTGMRRGFVAACKKAGIKDFRWHDLRHSFASWLVQDGVALEVVKDTLGHADIKTTMRYAHHEVDAKAKAMSSLGGRIS